MIITIEVTQADIDSGTPGEPCMCPIALAVQRALPFLDPWIDEEVIGDALNGSWDIPLPPTAIAFIRAYDDFPVNAAEFRPFSFDVEVPDEMLPVTSP